MSDLAEIWEVCLVCLSLYNRPTLISNKTTSFAFNASLNGTWVIYLLDSVLSTVDTDKLPL